MLVLGLAQDLHRLPVLLEGQLGVDLQVAHLRVLGHLRPTDGFLGREARVLHQGSCFLDKFAVRVTVVPGQARGHHNLGGAKVGPALQIHHTVPVTDLTHPQRVGPANLAFGRHLGTVLVDEVMAGFGLDAQLIVDYHGHGLNLFTKLEQIYGVGLHVLYFYGGDAQGNSGGADDLGDALADGEWVCKLLGLEGTHAGNDLVATGQNIVDLDDAIEGQVLAFCFRVHDLAGVAHGGA